MTVCGGAVSPATAVNDLFDEKQLPGGPREVPPHRARLPPEPPRGLHRGTVLDDRLGQGRLRRLRQVPERAQGGGRPYRRPGPVRAAAEEDEAGPRLPPPSGFRVRRRRGGQGRVQGRRGRSAGVREQGVVEGGRGGQLGDRVRGEGCAGGLREGGALPGLDQADHAVVLSCVELSV